MQRSINLFPSHEVDRQNVKTITLYSQYLKSMIVLAYITNMPRRKRDFAEILQS